MIESTAEGTAVPFVGDGDHRKEASSSCINFQFRLFSRLVVRVAPWWKVSRKAALLEQKKQCPVKSCSVRFYEVLRYPHGICMKTWVDARRPPSPWYDAIMLTFGNWTHVFWTHPQEKMRRRQRAEERVRDRIKRRQNVTMQVGEETFVGDGIRRVGG